MEKNVSGLEGKEIYKKYNPYDKTLISNGVASSDDIRRYGPSKNSSLPETDPEAFRANRGLQKEHTRNEIQSKLAAISHAQETGDRELEVKASLALIQILDEKIQLFIESEDYENAEIYIEFIQKIKKRVSELEKENVFEFEKGENLFLIEEVIHLINGVDIDREAILEITKKNPLKKINLEKQKELLEKKKLIAVFFLATLLDNLESYLKISQKTKNEFARNLKVEENSKIQEEAIEKILRESLEKTMKFISFNFCEIDEEALEIWRIDERIEKGETPYFTRKDLKKGVIFPLGANVKNISHVISWAKKFEGEDLEKIKESIFKNQEEARKFYLLRTANGNK